MLECVQFCLKHIINWDNITDRENQAYLFYNDILLNKNSKTVLRSVKSYLHDMSHYKLLVGNENIKISKVQSQQAVGEAWR